MKKIIFKILEIVVGLAIIAGAVYVYNNYSPKRTAVKNRSSAPSLVITDTLQEREFETLVEAQATTFANERIDLTANAQGKITKVNFTDGQEVETNDIVMELEKDLELAELRQAIVNLEEQKREFERISPLYDARVASSKEYDNQLTAYERSKLLVAAAQTKIDDRIIRVPFKGVIGRRTVGFGALVQPGTQVATLFDISLIKADFSVPEKYLAHITEGLEFTAKSEAYPDREFKGTVYFVDVDLDESTRTIGVRGKIPNPPDENGVRPLRPGMLLTLELELGRSTSVIAPEKAIMSIGEIQYLFICDNDNTVSRRPVKLGARRDGFVEILSGANAGEKIVTEGISKLVNSPDGIKITTPDENKQASAIPSTERTSAK